MLSERPGDLGDLRFRQVEGASFRDIKPFRDPDLWKVGGGLRCLAQKVIEVTEPVLALHI